MVQEADGFVALLPELSIVHRINEEAEEEGSKHLGLFLTDDEEEREVDRLLRASLAKGTRAEEKAQSSAYMMARRKTAPVCRRKGVIQEFI